MAKRLLWQALLVVLAVALDQGIKTWAEATLPLRQAVDILPFLALYRTYNTGIAFSMLASLGGLPLIAVSLCVAAFIVWLSLKSRPGQVFAHAGFALILGGALGNLIDRALYGHVVDYVLFHTPVWSFAVFNLADAFITIGAVLIVIEEVRSWRRGQTL